MALLNTPVLGEHGDVARIIHRVGDVTTQAATTGELVGCLDAPRRVEAERELAAERLASALESVEEAFAIFDAADRLVQCNGAFHRLVGDLSPGEVLGRVRAEIWGAWARSLAFADPAARARFLSDRGERGRDARATTDVCSSDGRTLRIRECPTPEGGFVAVVIDVSADAGRLEELRVVQRAAEEGSAAKTDFLASMSHELRTPLNAILGFAQLLSRDKSSPLDARQELRVAHILKGGAHLLRLIEDVLDLSRIEARNIAIHAEPLAVPDLLVEVRSTIEAAAAQAGVEVEIAPMPASLPLVFADRTRATQILTNFGSNAVKYNRRGGRLTFVVGASLGRVRVAVRDTGIGIPLAKQGVVFQPFQRAGQETGTIEGTGIGLAISRRLAQWMDATVGFVSSPGQGSTFWVDLPAHGTRAAVDVEAVPSSAPRTFRRADGNVSLVLCIEDNLENIAFMSELASSVDGMELVVAESAERGIAIARERRPDVVLMDLRLPGMSGLEALRILRASIQTAHIPVIALTATASPRDREHGERAGFRTYLTKPFLLAELEAAIVSALRESSEVRPTRLASSGPGV